MKRKLFGFAGALVILLALGLVLAGCDNGNNPDGDKDKDSKTAYTKWPAAFVGTTTDDWGGFRRTWSSNSYNTTLQFVNSASSDAHLFQNTDTPLYLKSSSGDVYTLKDVYGDTKGTFKAVFSNDGNTLTISESSDTSNIQDMEYDSHN